VFVSGEGDGLTLATQCEGVVLTFGESGNGNSRDWRIVPPHVTDANAGTEQEVPLLDAKKPPPSAFSAPHRPKRIVRQPRGLLTALHECGRSTTKEPIRFALNCVQLRGSTGEVIGTDAKHALIWGGFTFPFREDVLVPAVSVFAVKEWLAEHEVTVGRTDTHVFIASGAWTMWMPINSTGRYPDVASCIPRSFRPTTVTLSEEDAARVLKVLPTWPAPDDTNRAVTLDATTGPVLRAAGGDGPPVEILLRTSQVTNPSGQVAITRVTLGRALSLGLRDVRIVDAEKPVVFSDSTRNLVVLPLDAQLIVSGNTSAPENPSRDTAVSRAPVRRNHPVKSETNGPTERSEPAEPDDPLTAAEELRTTLAAATQAAHRLVQSLKSKKKEHRALNQVWSSLRSLKLPP
jgi:hypothetical protein